MLYTGLGVAIITPFTRGGKRVDYKSSERLIDYIIKGGAKAIIFVGTTGESPTLSTREHKNVISHGIEYVNGRVLAIAGTGSNNTAEALDMTIFSYHEGADAALVVSPYYNKPPQPALERHFRSIADATPLPNMLYDIFARTGVYIDPETRVKILVGSENVAGFKEASGLEHFIKCHDFIEQARTEGVEINGKSYRVKQEVGYWSGDDDVTPDIIAYGGHGAVSVAGNIATVLANEVNEAALKGDSKEVERLLKEGGYEEIVKAVMKTTTNPIPIKAAAHMMGLIDHPTMRAPMYTLSELYPEKQEQLEEVLRKFDLLPAKA